MLLPKSFSADVTCLGDEAKESQCFFFRIMDLKLHGSLMANRSLQMRVLAVLTLLMLHVTAHAQYAVSSSQHKLVVVELFQSQGCSSCPPAEANLNAVADEPGVLALSFGVTYWDDKSWKDTFATSAYTERQWNYAHYHRRDTVWTPQMYVNGHADLVGTDRGQLENAIAQAQSDGPFIVWSKNNVTVKAATHPNAASDVWLVRYDPHTVKVAIGGGENSGRTLAQRNVVHEFVHLGTWNGNERTYSLPGSALAGLNTAVLVQTLGGGDILSASMQQTRQ